MPRRVHTLRLLQRDRGTSVRERVGAELIRGPERLGACLAERTVVVDLPQPDRVVPGGGVVVQRVDAARRFRHRDRSHQRRLRRVASCRDPVRADLRERKLVAGPDRAVRRDVLRCLLRLPRRNNRRRRSLRHTPDVRAVVDMARVTATLVEAARNIHVPRPQPVLADDREKRGAERNLLSVDDGVPVDRLPRQMVRV